ncbi:MAG: tetratricopeptide repeat protein [Vicinamibacteria bacterium]
MRSWLFVAVLLVIPAAELQAQSGIARGKVVDENEKPVPGAKVAFEYQGGYEQHYEAKTNEKGEYTQIVRAGRYQIVASKGDEYRPTSLDHTISTGASDVPVIQIVSREAFTKTALEKDPVHGPLQKARQAIQAGKLDEAEALYRQVLEKDASIPEVHYNLGSIYAGWKDWTSAESSYRKVLELKPEFSEAWVALSRVYEATGRQAEALEVMIQGVAANESDSMLQYDLGVLHLNAKRSEEAEAAFQKVAALDDENFKVHYLLGVLALNRGDAEGAVSRLETYLSKAPEDAENVATARALLETLNKEPQP